ncbi:MAG: hypothetical protein JNK58_03565 [Phycisphaerae bacterium]|nr:hypothetical protein [Phycisphaerae bacterium]
MTAGPTESRTAANTQPPPHPAQAEVHTRPATPADPPTSNRPADVWERVRALLAANPSVAPVIELLTLEKIEGNVAVVCAPTAGALGAARTRRGAIEDGLSKALARNMRLELKAAETPAGDPRAPEAVVDTAARAQAMSNPLVRRAVELFDARVVDVQDDT